MNNVLHTKFGTARINAEGYYYISSRKEGNMLEYLHRLIFKDFYKCEIPKGYHIHHKNGIKTDNCILNLQLINGKEHSSLHSAEGNEYWKGNNHTLETIKKMSKTKNTLGYLRVGKQSCKRCKQGFIYVYRATISGKKINIKSVSIEKLKEKVIERGFPWMKL
jgi:hypothetical protein